MWFAVALASAAAPFVPMKSADDCAISKRDKTETDGAAMRAECTWSDADPAVLVRMFNDLSRYDEWIWPIAESRIERRSAGRQLVYQRQQIWGLADREVLLWVTPQVSDARNLEVRWVAASEEPLTLTKGSVRPLTSIGVWSIAPNPGGTGSQVVHQIEMNAGGVPLPAWLLRAVQTRGFLRVMNDVRAAALVQAATAGP